MAKFDQETLRRLHDCKEVAVRTTKHPGSAVTIWIVVSSTCINCAPRRLGDHATAGPTVALGLPPDLPVRPSFRLPKCANLRCRRRIGREPYEPRLVLSGHATHQ